MVEVESVLPVELESISVGDAQAAGYPSASEFVRDLKGACAAAAGRSDRQVSKFHQSPAGDGGVDRV